MRNEMAALLVELDDLFFALLQAGKNVLGRLGHVNETFAIPLVAGSTTSDSSGTPSFPQTAPSLTVGSPFATSGFNSGIGSVEHKLTRHRPVPTGLRLTDVPHVAQAANVAAPTRIRLKPVIISFLWMSIRLQRGPFPLA